MTKQEMIALMNQDLANEYLHMHFYLYAGTRVQGYHRLEMSEYLLEEAKSEMGHVEEFSRKILGLNGKPEVPTNSFAFMDYNLFCAGIWCPEHILKYAEQMESQVVDNYALRLSQADELGGADGAVLHVFYEDQMMDSRKSVDEIKEMLRIQRCDLI